MALKIIDDPASLERAAARFEACFAFWSGQAGEAWRRLDEVGAEWTGSGFADRPESYCFVERSADRVAVGVALTQGSQDMLRLDVETATPARARRFGAICADDEERPYLLFGREALALEGMREPLGRLAGCEGVRGAAAGGREYVLIGPFHERDGPDALLALAALHPAYERGIERRARGAAPGEDMLYRPSDAVLRAYRAAGRATAEAARRVRDRGWTIEPWPGGFIARRGGETLFAQLRAEATRGAAQDAVGALALAPPGPKLLLLPAAAGGDRMPARLKDALELMGVEAALFDLHDGAMTFRVATSPEEGVFDARAAFA